MDKLLIHRRGHTSYHGGGGSDGGDDLASNLFGLLQIRFVDGVVASTQIRCGGDERHMEVGVIVLLKIDGLH